MRRLVGIVAVAGVLFGLVAASSPVPTDALIRQSDLPGHWKPYETAARDNVPITVGICGEPLPGPRSTVHEASVSYERAAPRRAVFGERIEQYASEDDAKAAISKVGDRRYPCVWTDGDTEWKALPLRSAHLGADEAEFLVRNDGMALPYGYQYSVRRGSTRLAFVVSTTKPDRALAEAIVRKAVARYDRSQQTVA